MDSYRIFAIGKVVKDKEDSSDVILVNPTTVLYDIEGDLTKEGSLTNTHKNIAHTTSPGDVTKKTTLEATWLPLSDYNRSTAPDVCANEVVIIWMLGDNSSYYWSTMFFDPVNRKLERVKHVVSNRSSLKGVPITDNESYFYGIDTKNKITHLHTSNNDGEVTSYDIYIDGKKGILNISDGIGNNLTLNSASSQWNVHASKIILDGNVVITGSLVVNGITKLKQSLSVASKAVAKLFKGTFDGPHT